jgi:phosphoribosylaminoimidazole carboxylase (NCAIR synthetase)
MPKILLFAATTGYQTRSFAQAAGRAGVELRLATDRCHVLDDPWGDGAIALRFDDPVASARQAAEQAGPVHGIAAVGDRPAYLAALAAARLGLPFHPPDAVRAASNKFLARERFRNAGLPAPPFFRIPPDENPAPAAARAPYPCVLKPLTLSGSCGVIRANNPAQFTAACARIRALLASEHIPAQDRFVQVEQFIPGREFAVEGIMTGGRFRTLALFDKPDPLDGPFFEETIYVTPSRQPPEIQDALTGAAARASAALGLTHGPVHAEMRWNRSGVWVLEAAPRPIGGLCARALPGLEELILRHAAGLEPGNLHLDGQASAVMIIPIPRQGVYAGVRGIEDALATDGIVDAVITAKQGQHLLPLPEGHSYLGFLFSRAATPAAAEQALRAAHARLAFDISTALPVLS